MERVQYKPNAQKTHTNNMALQQPAASKRLLLLLALGIRLCCPYFANNFEKARLIVDRLLCGGLEKRNIPFCGYTKRSKQNNNNGETKIKKNTRKVTLMTVHKAPTSTGGNLTWEKRTHWAREDCSIINFDARHESCVPHAFRWSLRLRPRIIHILLIFGSYSVLPEKYTLSYSLYFFVLSAHERLSKFWSKVKKKDRC